jgi:hypothetical protein
VDRVQTALLVYAVAIAALAVSTAQAAPVIVAQRLRKGSCASPRGAKRLVADALKTVRSLRPDGATGPVLLRADSAFYGSPTVGAAVHAGAQVSVTVRMDPQAKAAIGTMADNAWTPIEYPDAVFDEQSRQWISRAEVAEVPFTAFSSRKPGRSRPGPAGGAPDPGLQRPGQC